MTFLNVAFVEALKQGLTVAEAREYVERSPGQLRSLEEEGKCWVCFGALNTFTFWRLEA